MLGVSGYLVKKSFEGGLNDMLVDIVNKFEGYCTHHSLTYDEISSLDRCYLVKVQDHKKHQFTIFETFEDEISESFVVRARNTFESYCRDSGDVSNY